MIWSFRWIDNNALLLRRIPECIRATWTVEELRHFFFISLKNVVWDLDIRTTLSPPPSPTRPCEILLHQHFLCSRGQKRRSCQHFSQHNNSFFPDTALPREITDTQAVGGKLWQAVFPLSHTLSTSLPPPVFLSLSLATYWLSPHVSLLRFRLSLLHRLPRVAALLRGHPSKFLRLGPCSS